MNRLFLSVHDKICSGVFRLHKGALGLVVLAALLILGAFMLLADRAQPQTLSGTWYSQEGDFTLRAEEGQLCINDFCFPFERSLPLVDAPTRDNPQGFVLEAGWAPCPAATSLRGSYCIWRSIPSRKSSPAPLLRAWALKRPPARRPAAFPLPAAAKLPARFERSAAARPFPGYPHG